jgi:hypothetical protein
VGETREAVAGSDHEPTSRATESVWMGSSSVGSARDDQVPSRRSRGIYDLSEGSLSPTPRLYHLALCGSSPMASGG